MYFTAAQSKGLLLDEVPRKLWLQMISLVKALFPNHQHRYIHVMSSGLLLLLFLQMFEI